MDVGIDIIEIERIEQLLTRFPNVKERLFTEGEIAYCERSTRSAQHYAARFAAKESVMKALALGQGRGIRFRDIEITVDQQGKPAVQLHGRSRVLMESQGIRDIAVSLSHCRKYATAIAVRKEREKIDILE